MNFPISGAHIAPFGLIAVGFVVGIFGGFFGVGGSFLAGPALFAFGVPMNFVVGTDLAHLVGKSIVAVRKHRQLGNIDFKLGCLMMIGTVPGVEAGAQLIELLKKTAHINVVVGVIFIAILIGMAVFMLWEGWKNLPFRWFRGKLRHRPAPAGAKTEKPTVFAHLVKRIQRVGLPPHVRLPVSGIERISLWAIVGISFLGGLFSGFLGGGAGYLRMPSMIYLLGIPHPYRGRHRPI